MGELLELGEADDLLEVLVDVRTAEAVDRCVQVDVLHARELGMEAGPDLEQGADVASHLERSFARREDAAP